MDSPIIEVKNISKKYNINHQQGGYIALRDVITGVVKSPLRFLKSRVKQAVGIETKEEFWALKDVNFTVNKGEVIGIIGRNGAGKSTLLKILSQITPPTTGEIKINGRVGSLLEVGTGFHPELTGRENIFLNGAILGMKKEEIIKKFDEIVKFTDIDKFLDTPVKYYSSGMYVRLAFSVAAHMDTDILIIDEVLAVGDAEFQKKCLGKMKDITQKQGRTILFVSHNMEAVKNLCHKTILIGNGKIKKYDITEKVIEYYINNVKERNFTEKIWEENYTVNNDFIKIKSIKLLDEKGKLISTPSVDNPITVSIEYEILNSIKNMQLGFKLENNTQIVFLSVDLPLPEFNEKIRQPGKYFSACVIPSNFLNIGHYSFSLFAHIPNKKTIIYEENVLEINTSTKKIYTGTETQQGLLRPIFDWEIKKIN
jgi:lipopolysaccharide transport system ATP-binding protein